MHTDESHRIMPDGAPTQRSGAIHAGLARRTLQLVVLAICVALLIATAAEAWVRHGVEQQVAAAQARNAALQRDIVTTQRSITIAQQPATIEREARAWGYIRAGDHPVVVTGGPAPAP